MGTEKPQFSCYLDPTADEDIKNHLKKNGQAKGKLVEMLWRFYNLQDLNQLYDKLASTFTSTDLTPQQKAWATRVISLLQTALNR